MRITTILGLVQVTHLLNEYSHKVKIYCQSQKSLWQQFNEKYLSFSFLKANFFFRSCIISASPLNSFCFPTQENQIRSQHLTFQLLVESEIHCGLISGVEKLRCRLLKKRYLEKNLRNKSNNAPKPTFLKSKEPVSCIQSHGIRGRKKKKKRTWPKFHFTYITIHCDNSCQDHEQSYM